MWLCYNEVTNVWELPGKFRHCTHNPMCMVNYFEQVIGRSVRLLNKKQRLHPARSLLVTQMLFHIRVVTCPQYRLSPAPIEANGSKIKLCVTTRSISFKAWSKIDSNQSEEAHWLMNWTKFWSNPCPVLETWHQNPIRHLSVLITFFLENGRIWTCQQFGTEAVGNPPARAHTHT